MKNKNQFVYNVVRKTTLRIAANEINMLSTFLFGQKKTPKALKKLRKF
jgi:cyclic lactone autoinducer peptide